MFRRFLFLAIASSALALDVHVAPNGSDAAAGSDAAPLATLVKARDYVRALRSKGDNTPAKISIHGPVLEVGAPLDLNTRDAGLTIEAAPGETPRLISSQEVAHWQPFRGEILKADVSGLISSGSLKQVFFGSERATLARYPNADPVNPRYGGWAWVHDIPLDRYDGHDSRGMFYLAPQDRRPWARPEELQVILWREHSWWSTTESVVAVDPSVGRITLADSRSREREIILTDRFYIQNALEELDAPGEWYFDKSSGTLYFWPPKTRNGQPAQEVRAVTGAGFFRLKKGSSDVQIRGLEFSMCDDEAISMGDSTGCVVENCRFESTGSGGAAAIKVYGGSNCRISNCEISRSAGGGISLHGGDQLTLQPAGHVAEDNHIHHTGALSTYAAGIQLGGVGQIARHNHIHDVPRNGIEFRGQNILIEYNHIHHTMLEAMDGGGIYTCGRDWLLSRGSVIRYNFIHDIIGVSAGRDFLKVGRFAWSIYMDDNTAGVDITGNICVRGSWGGLHMHNARDCRIENNIFVGGGEWQLDYQGWLGKDHLQRFFADMVKQYASVAESPAWKGMRGMDVSPENSILPDDTCMAGNAIRRNIIAWDNPVTRYFWTVNADPKLNPVEKNLIWANGTPLRVDASSAGADLGTEILGSGGQFSAGEVPQDWAVLQGQKAPSSLSVEDSTLSWKLLKGNATGKTVTIGSPAFQTSPGKGIRAKLRVRAEEPGTALSLFFNPMQRTDTTSLPRTFAKRVVVGKEWKDVEISATWPGEGTAGHQTNLTSARLVLETAPTSGTVQIAEIRVTEAAPQSPWEQWQSAGWDKESTIGNPLFVDAAADDYRLKTESPAWALGFEPIPIEKIGPRKR